MTPEGGTVELDVADGGGRASDGGRDGRGRRADSAEDAAIAEGGADMMTYLMALCRSLPSRDLSATRCCI